MHWSGAGSIATSVPEDRYRYNLRNYLILFSNIRMKLELMRETGW
jgi:hypothetical protein